MADTKPAPYPDDTRAKGWRFELDYEQIEQSDTWGVTKPEARPWLLMLWMTAWKQVPCGSMPADHEVIAGKLGIPDDLWEKHRASLLRGWWKADDGRLYHDTLTKRVDEMMRKRRSDSDRQAAKRAREAAESATTHSDVTRDTDATHSDVGCESSTDNRPPKKEASKPTASHPPAKAVGPKAHTVPCPYDAIVAAYHDTLPSLPRVRLMPVKRQAALRKLWGWVLSSRKSDGTRRAESAAEALEWIRGYFARALENDFLMGRGGRSAEHAGWDCDLDFLLTDKGMKHVIEKTKEAA
jgi:hypothetical protein